MPEDNGRPIKLTWGQVAWGVAVLVTLVGGWVRMEQRTANVEARLGNIEKLVSDDNLRHRVERIEWLLERKAR